MAKLFATPSLTISMAYQVLTGLAPMGNGRRSMRRRSSASST
ncbi:hypothetical protein SAMN04489732_12686 [Amycolatopsis saalfeldensis]|uniref:Uncharacterized protein n=1 Tax=Amycolatopsis saalfeldensis TaxID=394193 RepID=A0A1H8YMU3_9PSEU|nr:hypothetical protein SAMN04489732_12686 [Amycolatopsis saalfeldensis]